MNKNRLQQILVLTLLALCSTTRALAYDKDEDPPLEYAYNHSIDYELGTVRNLKGYSQLPDQGIALFGHDTWGFDFDLRYTRFFSRHWGAFFQFDLLILNTDESQLKQPLSDHYKHNGKEVRFVNNWLIDWMGKLATCGIYSKYGSANITNLVGAAYRYDIGRWSFRPHLGVGIILKGYRDSNFYIVDTKTQDMYEEVVLNPGNHSGNSSRPITAFVYSPAIQVTFSTCNHFFVSAEMRLSAHHSQAVPHRQ